MSENCPPPSDSSEIIRPGQFQPERHYYPRVLNATIHPLVSSFISLSLERLINRYCHLNPQVNKQNLEEVLTYSPRFLRWAGADLFHVTTAAGVRKMLLIETNSSPSGQKSMPLFIEHREEGGYKYLAEKVVGPAIKSLRVKDGRIAVLYDKNYTEASGYAQAMANYFNEAVFLAPLFASENNSPVRFNEGSIAVRESGEWHTIRAALRYVTQQPWNRIPVNLRTFMMNPIIACLCGGRNKAIAAMAYELYNAELSGSGLFIRTPETVRDVTKVEIPLVVRKFGGFAVVKIPYSNAGQGVYTITSPSELAAFMEQDHHYDRFIVQSLVGNYAWSSDGAIGKFYQVGTMPNLANEIFVADVRMMVGATAEGFRPIAVYCRRARRPLMPKLQDDCSSWDMLGTNLSIKLGTDRWSSDTDRLLLVDRKDFNKLGLGIDALIDGFIQTVLGVIAIDKMCANLTNQKGKFRMKLFRSINEDRVLLDEILTV